MTLTCTIRGLPHYEVQPRCIGDPYVESHYRTLLIAVIEQALDDLCRTQTRQDAIKFIFSTDLDLFCDKVGLPADRIRILAGMVLRGRRWYFRRDGSGTSPRPTPEKSL